MERPAGKHRVAPDVVFSWSKEVRGNLDVTRMTIPQFPDEIWDAVNSANVGDVGNAAGSRGTNFSRFFWFPVYIFLLIIRSRRYPNRLIAKATRRRQELTDREQQSNGNAGVHGRAA